MTDITKIVTSKLQEKSNSIVLIKRIQKKQIHGHKEYIQIQSYETWLYKRLKECRLPNSPILDRSKMKELELEIDRYKDQGVDVTKLLG
jgi:hypothetical protein